MELTGESCAGRSLLEMLWEELDSLVDHLYMEDDPEPGDPDSVFQEYGKLQGRAHGVSYAIAVIMNPYKPDLPAIKQEATDRAQDRMEE